MREGKMTVLKRIAWWPVVATAWVVLKAIFAATDLFAQRKKTRQLVNPPWEEW
jgi:hypothetical protein